MTAIRKRQWINAAGENKTAWLVDYRDQSGKRRAKQFSRKKDAEAWLVSAAWQVSQGLHTHDRDSVTVQEACRLWIDAPRDRPLERGTVQQYEQLARLHINPLLGGVRLSRLTAPMVEDFKDKLLRTRTKAMAAKALRGLSSALLEAQRRGLVSQNVARTVNIKHSARHEAGIEIPTRKELQAILNCAPETLKTMIMTAIITGMRSSELRGLLWSDVDLKGCSIKVTQRADKFNEIGPPKSRAGRRTIPIPPALANELREWKLQCPPGALGLAFPNTQGGIQQYGHLLRRKFYPLQIQAGVCDQVLVKGKPVMKARYGFHALRHAAASAWIAQKIDLKRLQVWMGHESIDLTIDTYGHLMDDPKEDARLAIEASADLFN